MNRVHALSLPMPGGWIPEVGDEVWVPRIKGTMSALVSMGTIKVLSPPYVRVFLKVGRQSGSLVFKLDGVRPVDRMRISDRQGGANDEV